MQDRAKKQKQDFYLAVKSLKHKSGKKKVKTVKQIQESRENIERSRKAEKEYNTTTNKQPFIPGELKDSKGSKNSCVAKSKCQQSRQRGRGASKLNTTQK